MPTTNELNFQRLVKEGIDLYENAFEAKGIKNRIKFANRCINKMNAALKVATLLDVKDKIGYIYEYITLSHTIIAESLIDSHDLKNAIKHFNLAKEANTKTLNNEETFIRECYIESKLLEIALLQKDWTVVDSLAQNILIMTKKITDLERKVRYLEKSVNAFFMSKNIRMLKKSYNELIKHVEKLEEKGNKRDKLRIAAVYMEYGEFLKKVLDKQKKAIKYLERSKNLYNEIGLRPMVDKVEELLNSKD